MIFKAHIVSDETKKAILIKKKILKKIKNNNIKDSNLIIVIGGDGFMLQTIKIFYKYKKPFYGINAGFYGFLMNKFSNNNLYKKFELAKSVIINPLEMTVKSKKNIIKKILAVNEISILRQSKQAAIISISNGAKTIIKKLLGDGVLVSSPAGSTSYNLSVHGPILDLDSKKIAISPISPFRPRRWKGKIISDKSKVVIQNLDVKKRPISAVADNIEVRNAKKIIVRINKKIKFKLLYDKNNSLQKKIKIEQLRKENN